MLNLQGEDEGRLITLCPAKGFSILDQIIVHNHKLLDFPDVDSAARFEQRFGLSAIDSWPSEGLSTADNSQPQLEGRRLSAGSILISPIPVIHESQFTHRLSTPYDN